jgi:hypothetical protein
MSLSRCGRLARVSLGALRTPAPVSTRALVPRIIAVRGVSSSSRDAQQKVGEYSYSLNGAPLIWLGQANMISSSCLPP